ncbi:class I SAM-dependent methyltransferase [Caenimonas aquaedulcis]|uniref:Methyltransferase domain-containing protein n=1 Tax=Caenimonas aquaedulcis TaxID=2793270 RepID=A0A931H156_9BURK|nr:class I SAM-dependent methyltransferase [Caenimonas aquaedulcis]MBG9386625.1 methyltransferase domain-containing protein [Caenimonas aquaedulcis]
MRPHIAPRGGKPSRSAALDQYRRRAAGYDRELLLFEPIRTEAIAALDVHRGDVVLDVGCGTGLSFEMLHDRIGKGGRIVGIEQCPEMLARARARVDAAHWTNVELVGAPAAIARWSGKADAALFHFTHDVLREPAAIANVLSHLQPGAHVVASGLQWAPPWAWPTNGFVMLAAMYSVTSLEGLGKPWDLLARHLSDVEVVTTAFGGIYIARGRYAPGRSVAH